MTICFSSKIPVVVTNKDFLYCRYTGNTTVKTERVFIAAPTHIVGNDDKGTLTLRTAGTIPEPILQSFIKVQKLSIRIRHLKGIRCFMIYHRNGRARHRVVLTDTTNHVMITGRFGIYNENSKIAFVTDSAMFIQFTNKDTLYMHAIRFGQFRTLLRWRIAIINFMAYRNVRFWKPDLQGKCDSLAYQMKDSVMRMFWSGTLGCNQSNDCWKNRICFEEIDPDLAKMENEAMIISKEDSIKFNQIAGNWF